MKIGNESKPWNQIAFTKLSEIDVGVVTLKSDLPNQGRCPKCTLKVPCKHYSKSEDIPVENPYKPQTEELLERKYLWMSSNDEWKTEKFYPLNPSPK